MGQESQTKRVAIFLDRDGVINVSPGPASYVTSPEEIRLISGVARAILAFRQAGALVIVVTNQRCVHLGLLPLGRLQQIHDQLRHLLRVKGAELDDVLVCPHSDEDGCQCRKPKPGMLFDAAAKHRIALSRSIMVGDSIRDLMAGRAAGCQPVGFAMSPAMPLEFQVEDWIPDWSTDSVKRVLDLIRSP